MKARDEAETTLRTATKAKASPGGTTNATGASKKQDKPAPKPSARANGKSTPKTKKTS